MRYLLINPADLERRMFGFLQPQGLGYLATSLRMNNFEVDIIDAAKENLSPYEIARKVKERKYDVVGFYVLSPLIRSVRMYSDEIKRKSPNTIIVAGGPHPTFEPEHTLRSSSSIDLACVGDGEEAITKISSGIQDTPNIAWRQDGKIIINHRTFVDINKYPMPAWDIIKPDSYPPLPIGIFSEKKRICQIITTRGCPYPCSFCGVPNISGKSMRVRKIEYILSEINLLISEFGIEEIHIIDDNITAAPRNWLIELLESLAREKFPVRFALPSGIRIDLIDEHILNLMWKARFYAFAIGIESSNQKTLDEMKKKLKIQKVIDKLMVAKKYDFHIQGNFIIGYPTESITENLRTVLFSLSLPIKKAGYFIFNPFPGTDEWEKIKKRYQIDQWEMIISSFNLYRISRFVERKTSRIALRLIQVLAYFLFYIRPSYLFKNIRKLKSFHQIKVIFRIIFSMITG